MNVGNPSGAAVVRVKDVGNAGVSAQKFSPAAFVDSTRTVKKITQKKKKKKKKAFGSAHLSWAVRVRGSPLRGVVPAVEGKPSSLRQRFCRVDERRPARRHETRP